MPSYETPQPISVTIEIEVGNVQLIASGRTDTVVEVRPSNPSDDSDVEAARATRVDYADGVLTVRGPKRRFDFSKKTRSVDVVVELPEASRAQVEVSVGDCRGTGVLGDCRVKNAVGQIHLDRTGKLRAESTAGGVIVGEAKGDAEVSTGSGHLRIGVIGGTAEVKNSNGDIEIGDVTGDLKARAANGSISVDRASGNVEAKSANGNVRVGEAVRGVVTLNTSMGSLEVGIARGTAAWLDVKTGFGQVHNELDATSGPEATDNKVEVRAQTTFGAITIRRA